MQTNIGEGEVRGILSHGNSCLLSNHLPFHEHHFSPIPNQTLSERRFIALVKDPRLPPERSAYACAWAIFMTSRVTRVEARRRLHSALAR